MRRGLGVFGFAIGAMFAAESPAATPSVTPTLADNFQLGSGGTSICRAQSLSNDAALKDIFDRAWSIVCRDAAAPVGHVYALRGSQTDVDRRLDASLACKPADAISLPDAGRAEVAQCAGSIPGVGFRRYRLQRGRTVYVAEGLAGYDSALTLALRSVVADRLVPGQVSVAITEAGDSAAFARVQAGSLDLDQALAEGYRRNNAGNYAEAAEFFDTLLQRRLGTGDPNRHYGEYVANQALQKSDLGQFAEADALFAEARRIPTADPVELRLRRNLEAINHLNQGRLDDAMGLLDKPVPPIGGDADSEAGLTIGPRLAATINSDAPMAQSLGVAATQQLTPSERAAILDAQALGLRGVILRRRGDAAGATAAFNTMLARVGAIRGGNVASLARLRSQASGELAAIAETRGDRATAEALYRRSVSEISVEYPGSAAVTMTTARLAAFLGRTGKRVEARSLYRTVITSLASADSSVSGIDGMLEPYFSLLAGERDPSAAADFFLASQVLVRPGLAETQAILTRELSGGDDNAAALFRQSTTLARDIERLRIEIARLAAIEQPTATDTSGLVAARANLAQTEQQQVAIQAELSRFPRYRAVSNRGTTLAELQQSLKADEAYWKLLVAGGKVFGFYATPSRAATWVVPLSAARLDETVDKIRASIVIEVNGRQETHPFDAAAARTLYMALAGPVASDLPRVRHLIFDPDGAMLRLPANLLITEQAGVEKYLARVASPTGDPFDLSGVAWLGRSVDISTSVSARAFEDVRKTVPSAAPRPYIGLGHNAPVSTMAQLLGTPPAAGRGVDCSWPADVWNHPISARELSTAAQAIGGAGSELVTGEAFNDAAIRRRGDLNQFRIVHFATHGLVAAPRPSCPARPALLTSVAGNDSDGLLTFAEIFDLRLDADLVILSACNTASGAGDDATIEAGLRSGGGRALDGLVRAFVGAGSRSVLASHWVAPDDYDATEKLITGLFAAPPGTPIAEALRHAQLALMDKADTSHPYYWSAFALVGDGSQPLVRKR